MREKRAMEKGRHELVLSALKSSVYIRLNWKVVLSEGAKMLVSGGLRKLEELCTDLALVCTCITVARPHTRYILRYCVCFRAADTERRL